MSLRAHLAAGYAPPATWRRAPLWRASPAQSPAIRSRRFYVASFISLKKAEEALALIK